MESMLQLLMKQHQDMSKKCNVQGESASSPVYKDTTQKKLLEELDVFFKFQKSELTKVLKDLQPICEYKINVSEDVVLCKRVDKFLLRPEISHELIKNYLRKSSGSSKITKCKVENSRILSLNLEYLLSLKVVAVSGENSYRNAITKYICKRGK